MPTELLLNESRTELRRVGWAGTRVAASCQIAQLGQRQKRNGTWEQAWVAGELDPAFWREPETGVIMLRPSSLRADLFESATWSSYWLGSSKWRMGTNTALELSFAWAGGGTFLHMLRSTPSSAFVEITNPGVELDALKTTYGGSWVWAMQTNDPLAVNEGFSFWLQPHGAMMVSGELYMVIAFGASWALFLSLGGEAELWANSKTQADAKWVRRAKFTWRSGGAPADEPVHVSVIPWGTEYISFVFSLASQNDRPFRANPFPGSVTSFTYRVNAHGGFAKWDSLRKQFVKTAAGTITVGLRTNDWQYSFGANTIRYASAASTFALMPEVVGEPKPNVVPTVFALGYDNGQAMTTSYTNDLNAAWTAASDTRLVPKVTLQSLNQIYTPEVWAVETKVPAETFTSSGAGVADFSDEWYRIEFELTNELASTRLGAALDRTADFDNMLKHDGACSVKIDGTAYWEGYILHQRPVLEGAWNQPGGSVSAQVLLEDDFEAADMWDRLEDTNCGAFPSYTDRYVADIARDAVMRAGFASNQFVVVDSFLNTLKIDGWGAMGAGYGGGATWSADDWISPGPGQTAADVIRWLASHIGFQFRGGLRLKWRSGAWRLGVGPEYLYDPAAPDTSKLPTLVFHLDHNTIPLNGGNPPTEAERWAGYGSPVRKHLHAFSCEVTVRKAKFNDLEVVGALGSADPAQSYAAWIAPHPKTFSDPTYYQYDQRVIHDRLVPPETDIATTPGMVERLARMRYAESGHDLRMMQIDAEWQPGVDVDQFAWVVGSDPDGNRRSYGAYRIDRIGVSLFGDSSPVDRRHRRVGLYTLSWAGVAESLDWPMFSTVVPPFGAY